MAQSKIEKYVIANISTMHGDSDNLDFLGNAIGDRRIVMLGEQSHGDAATFLMKSKIIKYLHETKNFNLLLFESDFYGLERQNSFFLNSADSASVNDLLSCRDRNINSFWSCCKACNWLLQTYIPGTFHSSSRLKVSGFDSQFLGRSGSRNLLGDLDSLMGIIGVKELPACKDFLSIIKNNGWDDASLGRLIAFIDLILPLVREKVRDEFWSLALLNLQQDSYCKLEFLKGNIMEANNLRDKQMAINLEWLVTQRYKGMKVIVWAANAHLTKDNNFFRRKKEKFNMNEQLYKNMNLNSESYVIGFTSYGGYSGKIEGAYHNLPHKVRLPKRKGFENWIEKKANYAFIDFIPFNLNYPENKTSYYMKALGHVNHKASWHHIFDGIFYIKEMTSCL